MISMTGFGSNEAYIGGVKISIQVSSLNRKQTDIRVMLPKDISTLEKPIRDRIKQDVARGSVNVKVELEPHRETGDKPLLDIELAKSVYNELQRLRKELDLDEKLSVSNLLNIPDIGLFKKYEIPVQELADAVSAAFEKTVTEFKAARIQEGKSLQLDITKRYERLVNFLENIKQLAPRVPVQSQKKLVTRLQDYVENIPLDDERVLKEVAIFADRCDISEETTRLSSHLLNMENLIKATMPVGRKLDFLIQEIFREINTIGSKANDFDIASIVIDFKTELERIREQIQNIE